MLTRFIPLCVLNLLFVCNLFAQSYNIVRYGVRDGVLHSLVTGITQDKRGDIWMSTGGGLCRFNGVEFEYITTKDGLNFTRLTCVAADDDDNIWVGSSKGLNFIVGKTILAVLDSLLGSEILTISSAGKSEVWVVASNGLFKVKYCDGIFKVSKISIPQFHTSELPQIFQDRVISSFVYQTKKGCVFYGNNGELFVIKDDNAEKVATDASLLVNAGLELVGGSMLFGTNKGLYKMDNDKLVPFSNPKTNSINIKSLSLDRDKIWILGEEVTNSKIQTNLYAIDLNNSDFFRKIGKSNGLTDDPTQMFIDHEGNLWATSNSGVSLLKGNAFEAYTKDDGLIGNKIWGVYRTNNGDLWVGTIGEGLTIIKENNFLKYSTSNGLPDNYVGKIYQTSDGSVLIGTGNAGICQAKFNFATQSYTFIRLPLMQGKKLRVDDILDNGNGSLWVASNKGLFFTKDRKNFQHFPLLQSDTGQVFVQKLLQDSIRNTLWVGTRYNGVFIIQNGTAKQFDKISSKEEISSVVIDRMGDVWFGTRNNGAFRYDGTSITRLTEKDGLASNLIYILYPDRFNNLWVGTNLGLNRVNLMSLEQEAQPSIRHYDSNDGLIDLETNLNGVFEDNEWNFWIATNGGLLKYDRRADNQNTTPPKVRIVKLKLNSQETDWQNFSNSTDPWSHLPEALTLKHFQNHLTFEFIGVSFRNPKLVKYAWKLDGFDNEWIISSTRQAIYSNIPPGSYTFKLKAANSDIVWSNEVQSMPFTIHPPFWGTWWFRIALILFLSFLIYLYILSRVKYLKEKQKELENLVGIRTLELREQFKIVDEKNKKILDSLKYAKFLQNAMLTSIDEIRSNFSDAFVYFKPKDIVSGDFYWYTRYNSISVFAVADCTGHGVPGAIISVICENALRRAVMGCNYENPAQILNQTNAFVIDTFTQTHKEVHHGMEVALCTINHATHELTFSGAKLGMYVLKNGELVKLKSSVHRIGWDLSTPIFTNETVILEKGNLLYLFTDGFADQFEPIKRKKFSSARLKDILLKNSHLSSQETYKILDFEFKAWKGNYEQVDDVLVVGIKI